MEEIKVKIQPLEWFEKNCYKDQDNDWWRFEKLCVLYNNHDGHDEENPFVNYFWDTNVIGKIIDLKIEDFNQWGWAVEKYVNKEDDPEYYL